MLGDEVRELLRELKAATGADHVAVAHGEAPTGPTLQTVAIGGGAVLVAEFASAEQPPDPNGRAAELERAARALRACARRWEVAVVPALVLAESNRRPRDRILDRARAYLTALAGSHAMTNAALTLRGQLVCSAFPLGELEAARLPFTARRVLAEAARKASKSSHASLAGDDFFAMSFFYDACLVCFFDAPYSIDFVRHQSRKVSRELTQLILMLEDPEHDPVQTAPIPE